MTGVGLVPIPKVRTYTYSGHGTVMQQLTKDVQVFTRDSIIETLRLTAAEETAAQIRLGNPPDLVISDGVRGKAASTAMKRIEVAFGLRLPPQALEWLRDQLKKNILRATTRRSGSLANTSANWGYLMVRNGDALPVPIGNRGGIPMGASDAIVLRPKNVPHATVANIRVAQGRTMAVNAKRAAKGQAPTKRAGGVGFLAQTTRAARRNPLFANFNVAVRFTGHTVPGELWARNLTATIIITPKLGRRARGRRR